MTRIPRLTLAGEPTVYHIISRTALDGFVLGVTEGTSLEWSRRVTHPAEAINAQLLRELPVTQVPVDELRTFAKDKKGDRQIILLLG